MPVESAADLVNALRLSPLLTPSQLEELSKDLQRRYPEARALARALMDRAWLTPYQINLLLQGHGDRLLLGPYVILERLGENTLGQVFKARHQLMNRLITLTIVREELLAQPKAVEQFYQEIQTVSQLTDPHIVHPYDAGPIGQTHFFAQEYVEGTDLERLVAQAGPLQVSTACGYIRQAAVGLQHAFERGLLHHDLRPVNLLIAKVPGQGSLSISVSAKTPPPSKTQLQDATIKISNLGLTLLQPRLRRSTAAPAPASEGTADFVAPEQVQDHQRLDIRSNLYSLGCIFYYLLAGRPPFAGGSTSVKLQAHQLEEPTPLQSFRRDVPPAVEDVIRILLAKQPEARYQTPAELLDALTPFGPIRLAPRDSSVRRVAARAASSPMLQPLLASRLRQLAAAGAVLLLFLLVAWLLWPSGDRPAETAPTTVTSTPAGPILPKYLKKGTREETILATLRASGLPTLEGKWYAIAPFDNSEKKGFGFAYPPEKEIDLKKTYTGKDNLAVTWKEIPDFRPGQLRDLKPLSPRHDWAVIYLYHEIEATQAVTMDASFGSDDTLTVWLNGKRLIAKDVYRGAAPDQDIAALNLEPGKNQLLVKVCQGSGDWRFTIFPRWPEQLKTPFESSLQRDFPNR